MERLRLLEDRVLAFVRRGPVIREESGLEGCVVLRRGEDGLSVPIDLLRRLHDQGAVVLTEKAVAPTAAGLTRARRPPMVGSPSATGAIEFVEREGGIVALNPSESPLAVLVRLRDRQGKSFLAQGEFSAGERLRSDYTRGQIMPRLSANWEARVASRRRGDAGSGAELTEASLAARQRVNRALEAVGPELSGVLVDVCCFLKGLELVERERSWPVRSAKIVLKTALSVLARHYGQKHRNAPHKAVLHWGADDYRPRID